MSRGNALKQRIKDERDQIATIDDVKEVEDKLENLVSIDDLEAIDEKLGTYAKEEDVKKIKDKLDNFVTIDDLQAVEEVVDKKLSKISLKEGKPGKPGKPGKKGDKGDRGEPGKDATAILETAESIVDKINAIDDDDYEHKIDASHIKGLKEKMKQINVYGGGRSGGGWIQSIQAGTNITVDSTDPLNPVVSSTGGGGGSSIDLKTNGTSNGSQTILDLIQGTNITLTDDGLGGVTIDATGGSGGGDVVGPASAINNRVVFFDGTTGKLIKDSGLTLSGTNTGDQDLSPYFNKSVDDTDDITEGTTKKFTTSSDISKLAGIEALADVTDATNVGAAGAFMKSVDDTDDINVGATNKFATATEKTKIGYISVTQAVDLDQIEADTTTNNAKVTNATHTGEMTGSGALTADPTIVSNKTLKSSLAGTEEVLINDAGTLKKTTAQDIADLGGGGGGTVTSVASADGSITITNPTTTVDLSVVKAPILSTTRTIWGQNFNGSANVTGDLALGASNLTLTGSIGATGARATKVWTAALESTAMPTVNGTSLSSTFQPLDSDLTTIAGLTATTDNFIVSVASAWASRTPSQVRTTLGLVIGTNVQAWDADLDTRATKTAPSGVVLGTTDAQVVSNKEIQPRVVSATSYTTNTGSAIDVRTCDIFVVTAQAGALLFNNPAGSPTTGEKLIIRIKDDGTARALTYGSQFRASSDLALPTTTVLSKTLYMGFIYNSTDTKRDLLAVLNNF